MKIDPIWLKKAPIQKEGAIHANLETIGHPAHDGGGKYGP
jgi:hypothetical protein